MNIPTASQINQWLEDSRRQKENDRVFSERLSSLITSHTKWSNYFEAIARGTEESTAREHLKATL